MGAMPEQNLALGALPSRGGTGWVVDKSERRWTEHGNDEKKCSLFLGKNFRSSEKISSRGGKERGGIIGGFLRKVSRRARRGPPEAGRTGGGGKITSWVVLCLGYRGNRKTQKGSRAKKNPTGMHAEKCHKE